MSKWIDEWYKPVQIQVNIKWTRDQCRFLEATADASMWRFFVAGADVRFSLVARVAIAGLSDLVRLLLRADSESCSKASAGAESEVLSAPVAVASAVRALLPTRRSLPDSRSHTATTESLKVTSCSPSNCYEKIRVLKALQRHMRIGEFRKVISVLYRLLFKSS